jgi:hypothetical protein
MHGDCVRQRAGTGAGDEGAAGVSAFSLQRQIDCIASEIALRERVYPHWVRGGKMKQAQADDELGAMRAVLATLVGYQAAQSAKVAT